MRIGTRGMNEDVLFGSITMPRLPEDFFPETPNVRQNQNNRNPGNNRNTSGLNAGTSVRNPDRNVPAQPLSWEFNNNPLLDGDDDFDFAGPGRRESVFSEPYTPPPHPETVGETRLTEPQMRHQDATENNPVVHLTPASERTSASVAPEESGSPPPDNNSGYEPEMPSYNPLLD
jgi:hypothetical protein